jgi:MtN3 and saliva related transmembrane protein
MEWLHLHMEAIGSVAAFLTTVAFIPQVVRTWRLRGAELSWLMLVLFGSGVGLWLVYGYLRASVPVMVANGVTGVLVLIILLIKLTCGTRGARQRSQARRAVKLTRDRQPDMARIPEFDA